VAYWVTGLNLQPPGLHTLCHVTWQSIPPELEYNFYPFPSIHTHVWFALGNGMWMEATVWSPSFKWPFMFPVALLHFSHHHERAPSRQPQTRINKMSPNCSKDTSLTRPIAQNRFDQPTPAWNIRPPAYLQIFQKQMFIVEWHCYFVALWSCSKAIPDWPKSVQFERISYRWSPIYPRSTLILQLYHGIKAKPFCFSFSDSIQYIT
jgi:hypothetical protein